MAIYNSEDQILQVTKVFQSKAYLPPDVKKILNIKDGDKVVWIARKLLDRTEIILRSTQLNEKIPIERGRGIIKLS